jgi:hypothetical protein
MIGSSCDSNLWSTRESLIQVTSTILISRGWTTPSLSCCSRRWCRWSRRGNRERLRQRLPFNPRSLQICIVYFMFLCRPLTKSLKGQYIYSDLGQDGPIQSKIANDARGLRWGPPCGQHVGPHGPPSFGPRGISIDFCYSVMAPEKSCGVCWYWSSMSLCVVNDQPVGNPKRKVWWV